MFVQIWVVALVGFGLFYYYFVGALILFIFNEEQLQSDNCQRLEAMWLGVNTRARCFLAMQAKVGLKGQSNK